MTVRVVRRVVAVLVFAAIATLSVATTPAIAEETGSGGEWRYGLTVYGWLSDIEGTLRQPIPGAGDELSVDAATILDNLEFTAQVTFEARRGDWLLLADVIYLAAAAERRGGVSAPNIPDLGIDTEARLELESWIGGIGGSRVLVESERASLGVVAGLRYFVMDSELDLRIDGPLPPELPTASFSQDVELWDGVVGVRGTVRLGGEWFAQYYADAGTGDSDLTWQALAGLGYRFGWGSLLAAYRTLNCDQSDGKPVQDFTFSGPSAAVKFVF